MYIWLDKGMVTKRIRLHPILLRALWLPSHIRNASGNGGSVLIGYMVIVRARRTLTIDGIIGDRSNSLSIQRILQIERIARSSNGSTLHDQCTTEYSRSYLTRQLENQRSATSLNAVTQSIVSLDLV
jgi:hypothetical protein